MFRLPEMVKNRIFNILDVKDMSNSTMDATMILKVFGCRAVAFVVIYCPDRDVEHGGDVDTF